MVVTLLAVEGLLKNPKLKHPVAHNADVLAHASQTPLLTTFPALQVNANPLREQAATLEPVH